MGSTPAPYDPIERMIRHTEEYMRRQIERELSLDGIQRRLSQLADAFYLDMVVVTPFFAIRRECSEIVEAYERCTSTMYVEQQHFSEREKSYDAPR